MIPTPFGWEAEYHTLRAYALPLLEANPGAQVIVLRNVSGNLFTAPVPGFYQWDLRGEAVRLEALAQSGDPRVVSILALGSPDTDRGVLGCIGEAFCLWLVSLSRIVILFIQQP